MMMEKVAMIRERGSMRAMEGILVGGASGVEPDGQGNDRKNNAARCASGGVKRLRWGRDQARRRRRSSAAPPRARRPREAGSGATGRAPTTWPVSKRTAFQSLE